MSEPPYYADDQVTVHAGDCLEVLAEIPDASVDSVVTDPPYDLTAGKKGGSGAASVNLESPYGRSRIGTGNGGGFMGKAWDSTGIAFDTVVWAHCLRVLRPGGHVVAFGGSRTWHRMATAIEDSGFEIRDSIAWLYGSGFPKSLNVGEGRGTALKPAFEPIVVGRKPLRGTVAANVLEHGTGALNIDGCRVTMSDDDADFIRKTARPNSAGDEHIGSVMNRPSNPTVNVHAAGRWPTNVVIDEHTGEGIDEQSGPSQSRIGKPRGASAGDGWGMTATGAEYSDLGGASRFFPTFRYEAKAPTTERPSVNGVAHPTVKPLDLMRWLVRLVTPPGGLVLDPFAGSGTTAEACIHEHLRCITIEREPEYLQLIVARLSKPMEVGFNFGEGA